MILPRVFLKTPFAITAGFLLLTTASIQGQADYMPPMNGWPAAIQTQWQVQGEYYGHQMQNSTIHLGVWLVANGGTSYGLVILPGGLLTLPGQPDGGWDETTRYQGSAGPASGTLNGKSFNVITSTGGFTADSITGVGESRTLYLHNSDGTTYALQRIKRHSPTLGFSAAQVKTLPGGGGVISLWDSSTGMADLSNWTNADDAPQMKYNYLYCGVETAAQFGTSLLHIEFLSCFNPAASGQSRANSGVYEEYGYENQVLDNFGLSGAIDEFGAIYDLSAPKVNAELPPQVTLQTYDIYFQTRTSGNPGDSSGEAFETVYANGVLVQDNTPMPNYTAAGNPPADPLSPGPIYLQDHGEPVVFNNIWLVPNATPTSLPYRSILAAAGATNAVNPYGIQPPLQHKGSGMLGFGGAFDLIGRKIPFQGKLLSMEPTVLYPPQLLE